MTNQTDTNTASKIGVCGSSPSTASSTARRGTDSPVREQADTPAPFQDIPMSQEAEFLAWRKAGGKVWCAPWCQMKHMGTYEFNGTYGATFGALADPH